jgi:sugar phosphate isomerase/epimerase
MNIAVMSYSYSRLLQTGEIDLPGVIRHVQGLGIRNLELMGGLLPPEDVPSVRTALAEAGLSVVCYDLVCDVSSNRGTERQARLEQFLRELQQAALLGARQVMVIPGLTGEQAATAAARQSFGEALRAALPKAYQLGITLTVENLGILAETYGRSEHLLSICEAAGPELRVTFDAGNFLLAGEDPLRALDRLGPRVAHVHFKDWRVVPTGTANSYPGVDGRWFQGAVLGEGLVPLRGVVERLRQLDYSGAISVEYEGPGEPREAVRKGVAYTSRLF